MSQTDQELRRKIAEEFTKGNIECCLEYLADDIRWSIIGNAPLSGKKAVLEAVAMQDLESYPTITVKAIIAEGEYVVVESTGRATTKTGKPYNQSYCDVYRFKNGKIHEMTTYLDTALASESFR